PTPAGEVQVMVVAFMTTTLVAALPPKDTVAPLTKPVPVMVTGVPPAAGPLLGVTLVTDGALLKLSLALAVEGRGAAGPVASARLGPGGEVQVMVVAFMSSTLVAALPPKATVAPLTKPVPVRVTGVPPAAGPLLGLTLVTVGALL